MKSYKKKAIILYTILMVFYGFYSMIVGILAFSNFKGTITAYKYIMKNLQNSPIIEINSVGGNCNKIIKNKFIKVILVV